MTYILISTIMILHDVRTLTNSSISITSLNSDSRFLDRRFPKTEHTNRYGNPCDIYCTLWLPLRHSKAQRKYLLKSRGGSTGFNSSGAATKGQFGHVCEKSRYCQYSVVALCNETLVMLTLVGYEISKGKAFKSRDLLFS